MLFRDVVCEKLRFHFIVCEIMFREACYCSAKSRNVVDVSFMPKRLHDIGERKMSAELQDRIDAVCAGAAYDAVLLGYGLCNYGVRGLRAPVPLVIPRAHDCVTLLMGSKDRFAKYFDDNPGTYFHSSGWIERDSDSGDEGIAGRMGIGKTREEYADLYGDEEAEYLISMLGDGLKNYKKVAYIDTGLGDREFDAEYARKFAEERDWEFEELTGDMALVTRLLDGCWDSADFLVVPPGGSIEPSYDSSIMRCAAEETAIGP